MNKLTYDEIHDIINSELFVENYTGPSAWMDQGISDDDYDDDEIGIELKKLGSFEVVDEHGGENEGSDYYAIYYFKDHDVYIKFSGWYASHVGSEYEEMNQVYPKQEVITNYYTKQ